MDTKATTRTPTRSITAQTLVGELVELLETRKGETLTSDVILERARNIACALIGTTIEVA